MGDDCLRNSPGGPFDCEVPFAGMEERSWAGIESMGD
jgi:hypothetical protein